MTPALVLRLVFAISATALSLFLSVLFFFRPHGNRMSDFLLGGVFACIAVSQVSFLAYPSLLIDLLPHLSRLGYPALVLMAPLIYCYVRSLTEPDYHPGWKDLPHALGFILMTAVFLPYYVQPASFKIRHAFLVDVGPYYASLNTYVWYAVLVIVLGYMIAVLVLIQRHEKRIRETFSNLSRIRLSWLKYFLVSAGAAWIFVICVSFFGLVGVREGLWKETVPGVVTLFLFFIGFRAATQPEIYSRRGSSADGTEPLDEHKAERYERMVRECMQQKRLFMDPDISLPALAENLCIPRNDLSYVINKRMGSNFYDFINSYRVEEVKKLMLRPDKDNLTLLGLALEAGFNSKATFNAVFKAHTSRTPSQFKRERRVPA